MVKIADIQLHFALSTRSNYKNRPILPIFNLNERTIRGRQTTAHMVNNSGLKKELQQGANNKKQKKNGKNCNK